MLQLQRDAVAVYCSRDTLVCFSLLQRDAVAMCETQNVQLLCTLVKTNVLQCVAVVVWCSCRVVQLQCVAVKTPNCFALESRLMCYRFLQLQCDAVTGCCSCSDVVIPPTAF